MSNTKKKHPALHLIAGGAAGLVESSVCHPLDTIKTRMQLRRQHTAIQAVRVRSSVMEPCMKNNRAFSSLAEPHFTHGVHEPHHIQITPSSTTANPATNTSAPRVVTASLGPLGTAKRIIQREGFFSLYKGLTAVYTGIVPKMAVRFFSFEQYRELFHKYTTNGQPIQDGTAYRPSITFFAGLASGLTEAVVIVTPAEVCKIRMQSQFNSLMDPQQLARRKYTNVAQTAVTIVKEEGIGAMYKGVVPTMMRQGCNQAVNFTTYNLFKRKLLDYQNKSKLEHWQSLILGGVSGGFGPLANNPLDVVKTRMQKQVIQPGQEPKYKGILQSIRLIWHEEGAISLWRGITPRLLRIMPGQAITFMTYEAVSSSLVSRGYFVTD